MIRVLHIDSDYYNAGFRPIVYTGEDPLGVLDEVEVTLNVLEGAIKQKARQEGRTSAFMLYLTRPTLKAERRFSAIAEVATIPPLSDEEWNDII